MKTFLHTVSALFAAAVLLMSGPAYADYAPQKVVYHVNGYGEKVQIGALRNIQNHINAVGADKLTVAVVMHGNGLSLLTLPEAVGVTKMKEGNASTDMQARVDGLRNQGVRFLVCANTLKGRKVVPDDHLYRVSEGDIVPSGVAELSKLQLEGYTYVKP
jgi:intracellular sulfur oxidation DsrE/DsrF family protein